MIVMVKMGSCDVLQKDVVRLRLHPGHHQRHHAGRCQVPMPGSSLRDHQLLQDSQVQMQNHQPHKCCYMQDFQKFQCHCSDHEHHHHHQSRFIIFVKGWGS